MISDDPEAPVEPKCWDEKELVHERVPVQIDAYGIKLRVSPVPDDPGSRPTSWREVALRTNKRLMSIAAGITEVIDDLLQSSRSFLKGLGALPGAVAKIAAAHAEADEREDQEHSVSEEQLLPSVAPQIALERLEKLLAKKNAEGHEAGIVQKGSVVFIFVGRPDLKENLPGLINDTLKSLPGGDDTDPNE